jgi:hypothetical protein
MDDDVFLASRELLEILSSGGKGEDDVLKDSSILIEDVEYKCSISRIKLNDYSLEIDVLMKDKGVILSLLRNAIDKKVMIPIILGPKFISKIYELELYDSYKLRIMSNLMQ